MNAPADLAIIGAGAAGLFCAGVAAQRGARVALVDHAEKLGEKIRISGGGRCNFTNRDAGRIERYDSLEPRFALHALRAYPPERFIELVRAHRIGFHEKHRGQLFCDDSAERIITLLKAQASVESVEWRVPCRVAAVRRQNEGFAIDTDTGVVNARRVVVATGGLSIPKIGATDFGHRIARQFGLKVVAPRPALVPLTFAADLWQPFGALSGLALPVGIRTPDTPRSPAFEEDLLFTHRGLSGPAALQASTFWRPGAPLLLDLAPGQRLAEAWTGPQAEPRQMLITLLGTLLPKRLAQTWIARAGAEHAALRPEARVGEIGHKTLRALAASLHAWSLVPDGTEGYRKAEVTAGGVATEELDPRTLSSRRVPGLHFIGEVVDVTGWLGGYNFQWAWASAYAAAMAATSGSEAER